MTTATLTTPMSETRSSSAAFRIAGAAYGIAVYAIFAATLVYAIGFICGFGVPTTLDGPATSMSWPAALAVNLALLGAFGLQHSIMARPAFKRWWTQYVPASLERQTYVLATCVCFGAMFLWWQPMTGIVWSVESTAGQWAVNSLRIFGWGFMATSTFLINHFDLFGLRQTWFHAKGLEYEPLKFRTPGWYTRVRHPIQLGFLIAFWSTPVMTVGSLLFAAVCTAYILVALVLEERDLVAYFGEDYRNYKQNVRKLVPIRKS